MQTPCPLNLSDQTAFADWPRSVGSVIYDAFSPVTEPEDYSPQHDLRGLTHMPSARDKNSQVLHSRKRVLQGQGIRSGVHLSKKGLSGGHCK